MIIYSRCSWLTWTSSQSRTPSKQRQHSIWPQYLGLVLSELLFTIFTGAADHSTATKLNRSSFYAYILIIQHLNYTLTILMTGTRYTLSIHFQQFAYHLPPSLLSTINSSFVIVFLFNTIALTIKGPHNSTMYNYRLSKIVFEWNPLYIRLVIVFNSLVWCDRCYAL